jgi:hypothetical protein
MREAHFHIKHYGYAVNGEEYRLLPNESVRYTLRSQTLSPLSRPKGLCFLPENFTIDLGISKDEYTVTAKDPKETESRSGEKETEYHFSIEDKTRLYFNLSSLCEQIY